MRQKATTQPTECYIIVFRGIFLIHPGEREESLGRHRGGGLQFNDFFQHLMVLLSGFQKNYSTLPLKIKWKPFSQHLNSFHIYSIILLPQIRHVGVTQTIGQLKYLNSDFLIQDYFRFI